jgi:hypothetical protein
MATLVQANETALLPRPFRRIGVLASRVLLRAEMLTSKYHNIVLPVYVLTFAALITGYSFLEHLRRVFEIALYCFYGLVMFNLFALFVARWLLDAVPKALPEDVAVPLDATKVKLVPPDSVEKFNKLVNLGEEAFAAWGSSRDERDVVYRKFLQANAQSFKLIMRTDRLRRLLKKFQ